MTGTESPMWPSEEADIFQIDARRCRRCGGLLTSRQAILNGCGPTCLRKEHMERLEKLQEAKDQVSFFDGEEAEP